LPAVYSKRNGCHFTIDGERSFERSGGVCSIDSESIDIGATARLLNVIDENANDAVPDFHNGSD
jgi:hypothetical protein